MKIKDILLLVVIGGLITGAAQAARQPNILFVLSDDLGYGDVGWTHQKLREAKGLPAIKTPHLDRLAKEGVRLTDHYSGCPVCAPSRASLLTGQTQGHSPIRDNCFDRPIPTRITLGTVMRQAGYTTYAVGKWGLAGGGESRGPRTSHPLDSGFDHFYGFLDHCAGHTYYHYDSTLKNGAYMGLFEDRKNATKGAVGRYSTDLFTARAKKYIVDHVRSTPDKPFFMYYAINAVHNSFRSDNSLKVKTPLQVPAGPYPAGAGLKGGVQWPLAPEPRDLRNTWIDPQYRPLLERPRGNMQARYATTITRMDEALGDLFQLLKDLDIEKETLIVFTSDNGPAEEWGTSPKYFESAGKLDGMKRVAYEGGFREPTFAFWPGTLSPREVSTPSAFWDWMATFADLAGAAIPAYCDGRSLLPDLQGKSSPFASTIYTEYHGSIGGSPKSYSGSVVARKGRNQTGGQQQMIRMGKYVAIRSKIDSHAKKIRLYDITRDPHQDHDLANDPAQAKRVRIMTDALLQNRVPAPGYKRPYDKEPIPALPEGISPAPVRLSAYPLPGQTLYVPDFFKSRGMEPLSSRTCDSLEIGDLKADRAYAVTGMIRVPETGCYAFTARGEGGVYLRIHGARILEKDQGEKVQTRVLPLKAGLHPLTLFVTGEASLAAPELQVKISSQRK